MFSFSIATARVKNLRKASLKQVQYFWVCLVVGLDPKAKICFKNLGKGKHFSTSKDLVGRRLATSTISL